MARIVAGALATFLLLSLVTLSDPKGGDPSPATNQIDQTIADRLHSIDGYFTENAGQVDNEQVRFYSTGGVQAGFAESAVLLKLVERAPANPVHDFKDWMRRPQVQRDDPLPSRGVMARITFPGSNRVTPHGVQEMPHRSNYFIGNDPSRWRTGVRSYREIVYRDLYDGIDLSYRTQDGQLKYEFIVDPGADPSLITVSYEGIESLRLDESGELAVSTALGELKDGKPIAYQDGGQVECAFVKRGSMSFGFRCDGRDPSRPLVVDPLVYATFLGGGSYDYGYGIAVDSSGSAYVTGETWSTDFPVAPGSFETTYNGEIDAFVAKLDAAGSALDYATFLGGSGNDYGQGVAVDSSGNAFVTGLTGSADFPTTPGSFDTTFGGGLSGLDAFVAKLDAAGSALDYATFLGGGGHDYGQGIAVDSSDSAYVAGFTGSRDFPTTPGSFDTSFGGVYKVFVVKLNSTGSALDYGTFLGGSSDASYARGYGIAVDSSGNAFVTGLTHSADFPYTPGSFDTTFNGGCDAFAVKLNSTGSALDYATFLGGSGHDEGYGIAIDSSGSAYVTGWTSSTDFPATPGSFDTTHNGGSYDAFVAKLDATGSALDYGTFLGGGDRDWGYGVDVDSSGSAYVTGYTESADFPVTPGSLDTTLGGSYDAFVAKLDATGSALDYGTFLGGGRDDVGYGIAIDSSDSPYATGFTRSRDFPTTPGSFDTTYGGGPDYGDGFVVKLDAGGGANTPPKITSFTASPSPSFEGDAVLLAVSATDAEGDALTCYFDFESDGVFDVSGPSSTATHVYGDDFNGTATVRVSDGKSSVEANTTVAVLNILPSGTISVVSNVQHEGGPITFAAHVTDPGSDDIFLTWHWGFGAPDDHSTYYNNGVSPDPYPSTDTHPRDITDVKTHTYGDNGAFTVTVFVQDDDSGSNGTTLTITATPDNLPPSVSVSGGMNIDEGQTVSLIATATDPGSDDLRFDWSWGEGSSDSKIYYNDGIGPDPPNSPGGTFPFTAIDARTHPYGDNGLYTVTLTVNDDDGGSTTWSGQVAVANLSPSIEPFGPFTVDEGSLLSFSAKATDPGSDDLTFAWRFELGPTISNTYYNNGMSPDPYPSPGPIYPFSVTDVITTTYGDNGIYVLNLTVKDDDGGISWYETEITVVNTPPSIQPFGPFTVDEGSPLSVSANATDAGSDDLTFTWSFELGSTIQSIHYNDGVGQDPMKSPWGTFPFAVTDSASHTYGDNAVYILNLTVTDDDGGVAYYSTEVTVLNLPPSIKPFGPFEVNEADPLSITTNAVDPGSDDLSFTWTFEYGPTVKNIHYNDGIGPDPPKSPDGVFPFNATDTASHTYGDNGVFKVSLTVQDDDDGVATYETLVTVNNVAPVIDEVQAYVIANLTLRVAGEKWHDVCMDLMHDGNIENQACVVRYPGSPDDQSRTITGRIQLLGDFKIILYYTPDDDHVNGQPNGANPAWVIFSLPDGSEASLHHIFNVQHNDTWVWTIDYLRPYLVGQTITFDATASDVGSDDLTFTWEWGDGTPAIATTYFNDGTGPDPYQSPDGTYPFTATDSAQHMYSMAGDYSLTLTVMDDDGGMVSFVIALVIP